MFGDHACHCGVDDSAADAVVDVAVGVVADAVAASRQPSVTGLCHQVSVTDDKQVLGRLLLSPETLMYIQWSRLGCPTIELVERDSVTNLRLHNGYYSHMGSDDAGADCELVVTWHLHGFLALNRWPVNWTIKKSLTIY